MITLLVILFILGIGVLLFLFFKISSHINQQFLYFNQQVNERLKEAGLSLETAHKIMEERLDSATKVFGDLKLGLGKLEENYRQIYELSKEISSLEELLRAPKFRGQMAETMLETLLRDTLPKDKIKMQYRFRNGDIVDAVIMVGSYILPIDAKFPLDNFRRFLKTDSEEEKKLFYRNFVRDLKNRIDEISSKYILPDEGTFNFAFMYIPSEAVYSQLTQDEELISYAKLKRIFFVSPNTFYAYLEAILYGLKGIDIQKNIPKIFELLSSLETELKKYEEDFNLLGSHLLNATRKYNDVRLKLEFFKNKLSSAILNKEGKDESDK
ncbi:MAG: DNA recombination protein RmuC [Candidatus Omnitrophica bacterium]|nr:DNA recombination protein RmuC [Candidatus Omnitrophota bacterium]